MKTLIAIITLALSFGVNAESYVCTSEMHTGFYFNKDNKSWEPITAKTDLEYIVRKSENESFKWEVSKDGDNEKFAFCESDFDENGFLFCLGASADFKMNTETLRFYVIRNLGYVVHQEYIDKYREEDLQLNIVIGKCSEI